MAIPTKTQKLKIAEGQFRHLNLPRSASFLDRFGASALGPEHRRLLELGIALNSPDTATSAPDRRPPGVARTSGLKHTANPDTPPPWKRRIGDGDGRRHHAGDDSVKYPLEPGDSSSLAGDIPRSRYAILESESGILDFFFRRLRISDPSQVSGRSGSVSPDPRLPNRAEISENLRRPLQSSGTPPTAAAAPTGPT